MVKHDGSIPRMPIPEPGKRERCPRNHEMFVRSFIDFQPKQKHYSDLVPNRYCALCSEVWLQDEP